MPEPCHCGKKSVAKGLCWTHYNASRPSQRATPAASHLDNRPPLKIEPAVSLLRRRRAAMTDAEREGFERQLESIHDAIGWHAMRRSNASLLASMEARANEIQAALDLDWKDRQPKEYPADA